MPERICRSTRSHSQNIAGLTDSRENDRDTITADAILQNLIKRPNVRSTLILSRKDGSIIKATGFVGNGTEETSRHSRGYSNTESVAATTSSEGNGQGSQDEASEKKITEPTLSPAQVLAESIYTFVASAAALAESLGKIDIPGDASTTLTDSGRGRQGKDDSISSATTSQADDDVQLLRLRLRKQEVIIFPDVKYLCCVVQDIEKSAR